MLRIRIILGLFLLVFSLITLRLFYWTVVRGDTLAQIAASQYYFILDLPPVRGNILANDGEPLVTSQTSYLVYAEPKKIEDKKSFVAQVAEILDLDQEIVDERISQENIVWAPLKHKVENKVFEKLKQLDLQGLGFEKEGKRFYPEASMAAHLFGFVGNDVNGEDRGYFGLEGYYELALKGRPGSLVREKDATGLPIIVGTEKRIGAENGQDLELYLDRTVQLILEDKLEDGLLRYGAKAGMIVAFDPKTGGVLGLAASPAYDPRDFTRYAEEIFKNPTVSRTYEPGSTFKPLVMAAALNERVIDPKTEYDETGPVKIGEYSIRTWNNEYHGKMTTTQILEKSSNPGMVFIGQKLGKDKLLDYIRKFGFGEKTAIDLEEEISPELRPQRAWTEIDLATVTFGQGIAVTPIQMVRAIAVLANEGKLMEPHVVKKIVDATGKTIEVKPKVVAQVIKPTTAKIITEMLISAVNNGEAKWAKPAGYRIAGKTGTAQIPVAGHYDAEKTIASFVGYAPADDPHFVMLVLLEEPTTSPWGSETAAPLFFNISKELFAYYGISPTD